MAHMWSHGLFGCFSDTTTCIITILLPCYTAGKNAEAVGQNCMAHAIYTIIPIVNIYFSATTRGKIRELKSIEGTFFNDLVLSVFCFWCALIQEAQEVKAPAPLAMARE